MSESPISKANPLLDTHSRIISEREIQRSLRMSVLSGVSGTIWLAMTLNYSLTLFMGAIGVKGVVIGMLITVRQIMLAAQVPAALYFEALPENLCSRKRLWAPIALAHRLLWFVIAGLAFYGSPSTWWLPWAAIVVVGLSDLLTNLAIPLWFSWMADLVPHNIAGRFWGHRQSIVTIGALGGMALAGFLLDLFRDSERAGTGFALVFAIAATFGLLDIILHCFFVTEPRRTPIKRAANIVQQLLEPLRNRDFLRLTVGMAICCAALAIYIPFSQIYLKRDFPITYAHVALLTMLGSVGAIFTTFWLGKIADKLGPRILSSVLIVVIPLASASWFIINTSYVSVRLPWIGEWHVPQAVLAQSIPSFITGAAFAGLFPCQLRLLVHLSVPSGRTLSMAVHFALIGVISSIGSVAGGFIMDWFTAHPLNYVFPGGTPFAFFHGIVAVFAILLWFVALPCILSIQTRVDQVPFKTLTRIINPFNVIRSLGSIGMAQQHERDDQPLRK